MFGPERCRVNDRLLDSKRAARSFKVLCGWSVVKAKTGVGKSRFCGGWASRGASGLA
jgi:hypothetical protein